MMNIQAAAEPSFPSNGPLRKYCTTRDFPPNPTFGPMVRYSFFQRCLPTIAFAEHCTDVYFIKFVSLCLGVLMWEVFTCGKMPYGRLKNAEVVERVQRGIVLERPPRCPEKIYAVITQPTGILMSASLHTYLTFFRWHLGDANVLGTQR